MKQYTKWLSTLLLLMIILCLPTFVIAQGDPGGDPDVVPVDGGLVFLAAAGVAYSVKKLKEHRKKRSDEDLLNK